MKIRADFVTNSSSSSYCSIHIEGSKLTEILKKYKELLENVCVLGGVEVTNNGFDYTDEESGYYDGPNSKNDIAKAFIEFISEFSECSEEPEEFNKLVKELKKNKAEINKTITLLNWKRCDEGWGGDDLNRYEYDYDDDFIREHLGLDDDTEITDEIKERFNDSLADAVSKETKTWTYDGKKLTKTEEFELL